MTKLIAVALVLALVGYSRAKATEIETAEICLLNGDQWVCTTGDVTIEMDRNDLIIVTDEPREVTPQQRRAMFLQWQSMAAGSTRF